jgi:hypothetical protein
LSACSNPASFAHVAALIAELPAWDGTGLRAPASAQALEAWAAIRVVDHSPTPGSRVGISDEVGPLGAGVPEVGDGLSSTLVPPSGVVVVVVVAVEVSVGGSDVGVSELDGAR